MYIKWGCDGSKHCRKNYGKVSILERGRIKSSENVHIPICLYPGVMLYSIVSYKPHFLPAFDTLETPVPPLLTFFSFSRSFPLSLSQHLLSFSCCPDERVLYNFEVNSWMCHSEKGPGPHLYVLTYAHT